MHDKILISLTTMMLVPTLTLAAGVATPPQEFFDSHPQTSAWLFGAILVAFLGAVGIIAKMVNSNVERAIRHSEQTNEAQWREIRNLTTAAHITDNRLTVIETDYRHCCGGRREYDPPRRDHAKISQD